MVTCPVYVWPVKMSLLFPHLLFTGNAKEHFGVELSSWMGGVREFSQGVVTTLWCGSIIFAFALVCNGNVHKIMYCEMQL